MAKLTKYCKHMEFDMNFTLDSCIPDVKWLSTFHMCDLLTAHWTQFWRRQVRTKAKTIRRHMIIKFFSY